MLPLVTSAASTSAAPERASPLVEVKGLRVALNTESGAIPVVRDVSFEIMPGEILGVVGESGAGKSMMGTALTGLIDPPLAIVGGEIHCNGRRIDNLPPEDLRKVRGAEIATIFQDPLTSLNPVFTIGRQLVETIEEHTELKGQAARQEAISLMAQVGIPAPEARLANYPHEFSGGMRQRVVIALALAGRPRLIVADEPTTALDVSIQGQIIALLRDLCQRKGTAVMLITHDMGVIAEAAQRVAVMYAGRIVEIGPVRDVILTPRHPYTRGLMGSIPEVGRRLRRLPQIAGAMPRLDAIPRGCAFSPRCPDVMDICRQERPELKPSAGHRAACWATEQGVAA
ncbi:dipeptide ABC transporter ATP binding subunit DppD [Chelatococcus asaccharovorans]|nr:dipeptide ABC transporter ATP binding subunit DppD [Chelatococcus asaccharovorans]CAH1694142.1 dipeptide ABC transporter ATP binding subunit DppD [Chelatococcus asaccharovorans]